LSKAKFWRLLQLCFSRRFYYTTNSSKKGSG